MRKRYLAGVAAVAVALVVLTAGAATAVATFRLGGPTVRQHIATSTDAFAVPGPNTWQTVPVTSMTAAVAPGTRRLVTARFSAESLCQGGGWCSVRVVYVRVGGPPVPVELAPQSGADYAFDSDGDSWSQHAVERTSAVYLGPGFYRVSVQAMRVGASNFRLDDYHTNVGLIAP